MDWILNLIPGGGLTAILAGIVAVIGFLGTLLYGAKKAGVNQQKAKEAEARERNLDAIKRAAAAQPAGSTADDPNNRDRLSK